LLLIDCENETIGHINKSISSFFIPQIKC